MRNLFLSLAKISMICLCYFCIKYDLLSDEIHHRSPFFFSFPPPINSWTKYQAPTSFFAFHSTFPQKVRYPSRHYFSCMSLWLLRERRERGNDWGPLSNLSLSLSHTTSIPLCRLDDQHENVSFKLSFGKLRISSMEYGKNVNKHFETVPNLRAVHIILNAYFLETLVFFWCHSKSSLSSQIKQDVRKTTSFIIININITGN